MTRLVALVLALFVVSLLGALGSDPAGKVYASQNGSVSQSPHAQVGDSAAGKEFWNGYECAHCHGLYGQGGYGPDLAGLGLTFEQFKHQVRQSWGVMPRWSEQQISDKQLTDVYAFLTSLPRVATPGVAPPGVPLDISNRRVGENNIGRPSRVTAPPNAPLGQRYAINLAGCAQCHGPEQRSSREELGSRTHPRYNGRDLAQLVKDTTGFTGSEEAVNWEYFKACVYQHEKLIPDARMGTYSSGTAARTRCSRDLQLRSRHWNAGAPGEYARARRTIGRHCQLHADCHEPGKETRRAARGCFGGARIGSRSQGCPHDGERLSGSPASPAERP